MNVTDKSIWIDFFSTKIKMIAITIPVIPWEIAVSKDKKTNERSDWAAGFAYEKCANPVSDVTANAIPRNAINFSANDMLPISV